MKAPKMWERNLRHGSSQVEYVWTSLARVLKKSIKFYTNTSTGSFHFKVIHSTV